MRTHTRWRLPGWALGWIFLALLLTTIPYVAGLLNTPAGAVFTGSLLNGKDTFSYFSKLQLGKQGEWCFHSLYMADTEIGCGPFYVLYISLGHLARVTGMSIPLAYHVGRVVYGALLGVAMFLLAARTLVTERERRLALALVLFTGGWGWLVVFVWGVNVNRSLIMDLWRYESSVPGTFAGFPHFALVVTCQIVLVLAGPVMLAAGPRRTRLSAGVLAALAALGGAMVHPHQLLIPGVILVFVALRDVLQTHGTWRGTAAFSALLKHGLSVFAIFLPAAILALAQWYAMQREPQLWESLASPELPPMPLIGVLALYGPVLLLALLGAWHTLRVRAARLYLIVLWLALQLVLLQLPFEFSSRYAEGLYVPVTILAAAGWTRMVAPWLAEHTPRRIAKAALPMLFASVALSPIFLLAMMMARIGDQSNPFYYIPADERAATAWLYDVASLNDVVLSNPEVGNRIPAQAAVHVLVGQGYETVDYDARAAEVQWFFDATTTDAERIDYLNRFGIDYVYVSLDERTPGTFDPDAVSYLTAGFTRGNVTVYVVHLPAASTGG